MFEQSPSGKVKFLALGELPPPGSCFVCGSGNREEGYVDTGIWLEYIGEGLICHTCVIEIGEVIGMMIPAEVRHLQELAEKTATENAQLKEELAANNGRLEHYDTLFRNAFGSIADSSGVSDGLSGEGSSEQPVRSDTGESETKESSVSAGGSSGSGKTKQDNGSSKGTKAGSIKL